MAPKTANKAKAVLREAKGEFAEALQDALQQEAAADEHSMAEAGKAVLKRPAAALDADEARPQRKLLKRPAAAAVAVEEDDAEEMEAEGAVEADEEEAAQELLKRPAAAADADEARPRGKLLKRPAAAAAAAKADEAEEPEAESTADAEEEEEEAPEVMKKPAAAAAAAKAAEAEEAQTADAAQAPTEQPPKREKQPKPVSKTQEFINAVHSTIASIIHKASPAAGVKLHPAALTTFDEEGFPSTRTVIPHHIADDLTEIRVTSQAGTRKESELSANPKASLHFQDQRGKGGWVTLKGQAAVKPTKKGDKVDIVLRPSRVEVMSYNANIMGDANGWKPATMIMTSASVWRRTDGGAAASA